MRLDPENEWARQGIIEALKAQNFLYAWMLKYFLWMSRLSENMQWAVILGAFFGMRILRATANANPQLQPYVLPIQVVYLIFVFLTWTANPLFNLLLRLNKFGRMVLNDEEIVASNWVGGFVGIALIFLAAGLAGYKDFLLGAMVFGFSVLPLSAVFNCQDGWTRRAMTAYTMVVSGSGIAGFLLLLLSQDANGDAKGAGGGIAALLLGIFFIGVLLAGWVANALIMRRPTR